MSFSFSVSRSGGLIYHLRSLRHRKLWDSHRRGVAHFLQEWNPKAESLVLIGPSGGYSLPLAFLQRFKRIVAVEPDPLARFFFERNLGIRPRWIREPFPFNTGLADSDSIRWFRDLEQSSGADGVAILFCNLLGQIPIESVPLFQRSLFSFLDGRIWASYHDAFSTEAAEWVAPEQCRGRLKVEDAELRNLVQSHLGKCRIELNQHLAFELFQGLGFLFHYWDWSLKPGSTHLIEGVYRAEKNATSD